MAKRHLFSYFVPDVAVIGAAKSSVDSGRCWIRVFWANARGCRRVKF